MRAVRQRQLPTVSAEHRSSEAAERGSFHSLFEGVENGVFQMQRRRVTC